MSQRKKQLEKECGSNNSAYKKAYGLMIKTLEGLCEFCHFNRGCNRYKGRKGSKSWKNSTKNSKQYLKNIFNKKKNNNPRKRSWDKNRQD